MQQKVVLIHRQLSSPVYSLEASTARLQIKFTQSDTPFVKTDLPLKLNETLNISGHEAIRQTNKGHINYVQCAFLKDTGK